MTGTVLYGSLVSRLSFLFIVCLTLILYKKKRERETTSSHSVSLRHHLPMQKSVNMTSSNSSTST